MLLREDHHLVLRGRLSLGGELLQRAVDHDAGLAVVHAGGKLAGLHARGAQVAQVRGHGQVVVLPHAVGALAWAVLHDLDAEVALGQVVLLLEATSQAWQPEQYW